MSNHTKMGFMLRSLSTLALVVFVSQSAAHADFVKADIGVEADLALNLDKAGPISSFTGQVKVDNTTTFNVGIVTNVLVNASDGNATIKPVKDGSPLTELTFTPASGSSFTNFTFRGQLTADGATITVTVTDNLDVAHSFDFLMDKANQDFTSIGVIALDQANQETIKSVVIEVTGASFKEQKLSAFGYDTVPDPTPHIVTPVPSSLVMLGSLLVPGLGFCWYRRRYAVSAAV
jgi:hypothetical protein